MLAFLLEEVKAIILAQIEPLVSGHQVEFSRFTTIPRQLPVLNAAHAERV
jgi:hypothetical protein